MFEKIDEASKNIINQIAPLELVNYVFSLLKKRDTKLFDYDNTEFFIDSIEYDQKNDKIFVKFEEELM